MARYINRNYDQHTMVVINFKEHLQPGTFEYTLHDLFEHHIDLSFFDEVYRNDDGGRPAIHPAILLKIILFAYSKGVTSSREIEWCCSSNVTFMALSCHTTPHWTTIASFVSSFNDQISHLFERVLLICDQQGLLGHDLIAIDGCKMPSNAAKEWSGTINEPKAKHCKIKKRIKHALELHRKLDAMGRSDLAERHQQAAQTMQTAVDRIAEFLTSAEPRMGRGKRPKEVKSNITDNESAKMTTSKGTIQGYNGVAAVDKKHQVIVDATAFGEGQEHHSLQPVLEQIRDRYHSLGINDDIFDTEMIITADTGFANEANMKYLKDNSINGYIPDNQFRSRDPKFKDQKIKYPKRKRNRNEEALIPASEFTFDPAAKTCMCPMGESMWLSQYLATLVTTKA